MKVKPTYKFTYSPGPYFLEQVTFLKLNNDDEADAYADGLRLGGARDVKWRRVIS